MRAGPMVFARNWKGLSGERGASVNLNLTGAVVDGSHKTRHLRSNLTEIGCHSFQVKFGLYR